MPVEGDEQLCYFWNFFKGVIGAVVTICYARLKRAILPKKFCLYIEHQQLFGGWGWDGVGGVGGTLLLIFLAVQISVKGQRASRQPILPERG